MTGIELAQSVFPNATEAQASALLWAATSFPFGIPKWAGDKTDVEWYTQQLQELHDKAGGDIAEAFAINDTEIEEAMQQARSKRSESAAIATESANAS